MQQSHHTALCEELSRSGGRRQRELSWGAARYIGGYEIMSGRGRVLTRTALRGWGNATESLFGRFWHVPSAVRTKDHPPHIAHAVRWESIPITMCGRCVSRIRAKSGLGCDPNVAKWSCSGAAVGWRLVAMSPSLSQPHLLLCAKSFTSIVVSLLYFLSILPPTASSCKVEVVQSPRPSIQRRTRHVGWQS